MTGSTSVFALITFTMVLTQLPAVLSKVDKINKRVKKLAQAPYDIGYQGLEYPSTGVEIVNLVKYLAALIKHEADARNWLEEHPAQDEPELSNTDNVRFWVRESLMKIVFRCMWAFIIVGVLALPLYLGWTHIVEFLKYYQTTAGLTTPLCLHFVALLSVFASMLLFVIWLVLRLISRTSSKAMKAWTEWDELRESTANWQAKRDAIDRELLTVRRVLTQYATIHGLDPVNLGLPPSNN